jgi:hypothetical protein
VGVVGTEIQIVFEFLYLGGKVNIFLTFGRHVRGNYLNSNSLKVFKVKVAFLFEVGSNDVLIANGILIGVVFGKVDSSAAVDF